MQGQVYRSTGSWYMVKVGDSFYDCKMKGKIRLKGLKTTNPVAVGDIVDIELEQKGDETVGLIRNIHDRRNYIIRRSVKLSKQVQMVAANIDQVFLMVTLNNPPTSTTFIDRYLVAAEAYGIPVRLLFNKLDSYDMDDFAEMKFLADTYREIGYTCVGTSVVEERNIDKVVELMKDKTSLFAGHSGVGKSSLINLIAPELDLNVKEISEQHIQGKHTTTFAEMFDLDIGAKIIDSPGIKGFGLVEFDDQEIADYFPEFNEHQQDCKFNNCLHDKEPKCAVKEAVEADQIPYFRYESYLKILHSEEDNYRKDIHHQK